MWLRLTSVKVPLTSAAIGRRVVGGGQAAGVADAERTLMLPVVFQQLVGWQPGLRSQALHYLQRHDQLPHVTA